MMMLATPRFAFAVDPPKPMTGEHEGKYHYRGRLVDRKTGQTYENAVRLNGPADEERAIDANSLLRTWGEDKAYLVLHADHAPVIEPKSCLWCYLHADPSQGHPEPMAECPICQAGAKAT